ncbi:hypothetical protein D3OALGA1CA_1913 [Olavius algarvensis associated proteobacterium Delta 3]|nr:hypothetical protein D3OALGA1CA_1913 [Olavius algarvensis associated proteobacterium Delta 3]CAB5118254.1 hypothetical protein D3OALGB2SA_2806 [Olavius algarvensis associated proteobacterium Delta 3]
MGFAGPGTSGADPGIKFPMKFLPGPFIIVNAIDWILAAKGGGSK